jgi:fucose permease
MATTLLGPILPSLAVRWHLSDRAAGAFFTAQFLSSMTLTVLAPAIAARIGARLALTIGFLLVALGIGTIEGPSYGAGLASTSMYGCGLGLVLPLTNIVVAAAAGTRSASALNLVNAAWGIGAMCWPMVVARMTTTPSMRNATMSLAIACVIQAALCAVAIPGGATGSRRSVEVLDELPAGRPARLAALYATLIFIYVGVENAIGGWVAEYARRVGGGVTEAWALAPMAFWTAQTGGRLLAPLALAAWRESIVLRGSLAIGGLGLATVLGLASSAGTVAAAAAVAGFGLAAVFPLLWNEVTRSIAPRLPGITGALFASGGFGGAVLPWVVGAVSSSAGSLRAGMLVPLIAIGAMFALLIGPCVSHRQR